jgi:hypothetical protein
MAGTACIARSGERVVPLVELYTSEGCSSCPPADRWFSSHVQETDANWLAFHVDYWDYIGWKDRFASPAYARRQHQRVSAAAGWNIYTPQVMLGADVHLDWRSATRVQRALQQARTPADTGLALRLQPRAGQWGVQLGAARAHADAPAARVWLAQYVDGQVTQVRAGENRGATLRHDHVVRQLWGPWTLAGTPLSRYQLVPVPSDSWGLVAFVEDARGATLQSLALPARACLAEPGS